MKTTIQVILLVLLAAILPSEAQAAVTITSPSSDTTLRPSTKVKRPMVIDFNASWCGPCRSLAPVFKAVADKYKGKAAFVSVDIDRYPQTAKAFALRAVPTIVILMPGKRPTVAVGAQWLEEADPVAAFEQYVKSITGL